jgi:hypothetical protein
MHNDVIITPKSGSIDFIGSSDNTVRIQLDPSGELAFSTDAGKIFGISDQAGGLELSGSLIANRVEYNTGTANIVTTGSITTGIFNSTELIYPTISPTEYSGASIEYTIQREGAVRSGIVMSSWSGSIVRHTDISNTDVGDTSDLSFNMVFENSNIRLRAYSAGSGSGEWTIHTLFKLFPNLL